MEPHCFVVRPYQFDLNFRLNKQQHYSFLVPKSYGDGKYPYFFLKGGVGKQNMWKKKIKVHFLFNLIE
jgi:hypothetical protein